MIFLLTGDLEQLYEHLVTLNSALVFFQGKLAKESFVEVSAVHKWIKYSCQSFFFFHTEPNYCELHAVPFLSRETTTVFEFNSNVYKNSVLCFLCISSATVSPSCNGNEQRGLQY